MIEIPGGPSSCFRFWEPKPRALDANRKLNIFHQYLLLPARQDLATSGYPIFSSFPRPVFH